MKKNLFAFAATAVLTVLAQAAAAQPVRMDATVPVAFRTAQAALPEGRYQVLIHSLAGGAPLVTFRNEETGKVAAAVAIRSHVKSKSDHAMIRFGCIRRECHLETITRGTSQWSFTTRKLTQEEKQQLYTVITPMERSRNDE